MPRTIGTALKYAACSALALAAPAARAAEEDTQFWSSFTLAGPLTETLDASLEVSPRFRGAPAGGDQLLTRAAADYRLSPSVALGGGLALVEFAGGSEWRPHQQATLTAGRLAFRTRLEQRFFAGAERMELRLRQRVQASFPLTSRSAIVASGEVFGILRPRRRAGEERIEQWRAQAVLRHRFSTGIEASAGYLLIHAPVEGGADRVSHVPLIGLTLRP